MMENGDLIKRLNFENLVWLTFIIISAIDIYGDELIKKGVTTNDKKLQEMANNLFLFVILVSIIIYIYFFWRNYHDYKKHHNELYKIRLFASSLILIGTILLLYFQLNINNQNNNLPSNV